MKWRTEEAEKCKAISGKCICCCSTNTHSTKPLKCKELYYNSSDPRWSIKAIQLLSEADTRKNLYYLSLSLSQGINERAFRLSFPYKSSFRLSLLGLQCMPRIHPDLYSSVQNLKRLQLGLSTQYFTFHKPKYWARANRKTLQ